MSNRPKRVQYFTFLVYPESAPKDWIEILREFRIPMYLSQHDCDEDLDGDGLKKEHYHIMVMFDSLKGIDACDEMIEAVNGVKPPIETFVIASKRSYARYLLHYDDPHKYPYYKDHKVIELGGVDPYEDTISSKSQQDFEETQMMQDIQDYMEKKGIYNFAAAQRLVRKSNNLDWFRCMKVNAYYFHAWFKSFNDPKIMEQFGKVDKILEGDYSDESNNRRDGD